MRKSSKARLFSTCLTGAILAAAAPAWGQTSDAPTWKPRAEAEAQAGKDIGVSTSLFAPIAQNDSSLVYVDGRIGYDQRYDRNGSATLGARFRAGEDTAIGVNVGADFYRSDIGSRDQAALSMGLEGFSSVFDVRVNYRLPLSKVQTIGYIDPAAAGSAALVLESNRLIERRSGFRLEAIPLRGFNGEAGVRLPVGDNASIRGSVGGFDYRDSKADENYRGVRGGLELDIEDRDSGTRFTFGGTVEHDNRFGTDARAHVRLSIPFGGRAGDRGATPTGLDRQMGDRVRRDYVARSGSRYTDLTTSRFAVDARTGNAFGGFYYTSGAGVTGAAGTLASPTTIADAVSRAGTNGVVVALGNAGSIATPGVTLATDQYLVGGASAVDVRLIDGSTASYALGGTNGVIVGTSAAGAAVTLGQGSVVRDVTVRGAGVGIAANGVGGFALDRVTIENTGGAGLSLTNTLGAVSLTGLTIRGGAGAGVLINGGSSVSLANSTISGGAGAIDINDGGANLSTALSNLTLSATGGNVLDIDGSGAGTITVTNLSGITIRGGAGETGGLSVRSATFDASTTTAGIQVVNAGRMEVGTSAARVNGQGVFLTDITGSLSFADLDIANAGATGLRVVNSKANGFTLATLDGTIDTIGGTAADLDPLVINLNFASMSSVGAAGHGVILHTVEGGGTGGNALTIGTLTISNSGGGLLVLNSTGVVRVNGGAITNSGGNWVQIGERGVAGSGGNVNLIFAGSIIDTTGASPIVAIYNTGGTISFVGPITGSGSIVVEDTLAGSAISFGAITLTGTVGDAITLNNVAGSINFAGLVTIANPGANGIVIGNVPGGVTFGDVDITGLGNFNGLDVRNTQGTVLFNTLDITGTGTGTGINVTGSTNSGNVIVLNASVIQGVHIGVDLTQANMTGQFRFGDGNPVPMNSTISADNPIVIALMNASNGSYNFADANLVGDTSNLTGAGFTAYYARVGATGAGTRSDPGSLAGADASSAQYIVLLNDSAGGQDVFDAAEAGGSFDLAAGQSLVSFLNGDFVAVSGAGVPANLTVSGVGPAGITNVYTGSGAALLTTTTAGSATVNLANNARIDGLVIRNAGNDVGVEGVGVSGVTIANSDIGGSAGAIAISDGGAAASVTLTNLALASTSGMTLALSGAGAGTLTVSAADIDIAATGTSAALSLTDVSSGGIGFGSVSTEISATSAVSAQNLTGGGLTFGSIAVGGTLAGEGVAIGGTSSPVTIGSISVAGSDGDAVQLTDNGTVNIGSITATVNGNNGNGLFLSGAGDITIASLTTSGGDAGLAIDHSLGTIAIGAGSISGAEYSVSIDGVAVGSSVSIGALAISGSVFDGIGLEGVDGSVAFTGTTSISGVGRAGILLGGNSTGTIAFGDVDITGLGANTTGVYARDASGTVRFNTLDITGSSTTGTRGIDLTGASFATNFTTTQSGSITGVGIGVDLTNAAITGSFRYGDGSNTDADGAASSINAVTPIVITGVNAGTGSYDFLDVVLTGDTTRLTTSTTLYFVKAGATGIGTLADPGSLAGAEASAADTIILLNDPTGGQDVLDAAGAGGSFDLAAGRDLLSFLNGDTLMLPGGAPSNLLLYGLPQGQIGNPYAGSGAPVLTTTVAGAHALSLGGSNMIDGVSIQTPVGGGYGVLGIGLANVTIRNSAISGHMGAIYLGDGIAASNAALSNLQLASSGGTALELNGSGTGTLTLTALTGITVNGGNGETGGLSAADVTFDADLATAGAQTVVGAVTIGAAGARVGGNGFHIDGEGSLELTSLNVFNANGVGVDLNGNGSLTAVVRSGSIDTSGGAALVAQNASLTLDFGSITATGGGISMIANTAANAGEPVLNVASLNLTDGGLLLNGSGDHVFANASITHDSGYAVELRGSVNLDFAGDITSTPGAVATLWAFSHTGTANFHDGTIDVAGGEGLFFIDADGSYSFTGTTTMHADGGISILSGSSGTMFFGAGTSATNSTISNFFLDNSDANVTYLGSLSQSAAGDNFGVIGQTGGTLDFSQATISASTGAGMIFTDADGNTILGDVQLSGGARISITGGSSGTISFDNVDITGLGANQTAVDLTGATGNVTFQTLDIAGISTTGSKGIDLTGSTTAANIIVTESSSITGVGVGVDLTNAAITGTFRYGDGSSVDADGAASSISAVTPLVIAGLNPGVGTYNFADVVLTGDTSGLQTNKTVFWVQAGATGAGTRSDPGSLAAAEASGADVLILLDTQIGAGQDLIDAASAGGSLDLIANQSLLSFLNGDTLSVGGGAPANLLLFGLAGGTVTNPYAGSGAALLTTSQAGANTVNLASGALIDGVQIGNLDARGVYGAGVTGVTIRNSAIFGDINAVQILDNGVAANVALSNLALSGGNVGGHALSLVGNGGGQLTVTQLTGITVAGGSLTGGVLGQDVIFDADLSAAGIQTVTGTIDIGSAADRVAGFGFYMERATGALSLATTVFNTGSAGLFASGDAGGFTLAITGGTIDSMNALNHDVIALDNLSADIQLTSVNYAGSGIAVIANDVTGVGAGGRALDIGTLTVTGNPAVGVVLAGTTSGNFNFGNGSSIVGSTTAAIELSNTGAGNFSYAGDITGITTGALVLVGNGNINAATFSGTLSATGGTGLQFDDADGSYNFTGTTTLNGGDAGIDIVNGSGGTFAFGTGTSITSPTGAGINIANSTAGVTYTGNLTFATAGQAAVNVVNHSVGTILFQTGTISATNGTGVRFDNADGTYNFTGPTTLGGTSEGIRIANGSAGTFSFGTATSVNSMFFGLIALGSQANITYSGTLVANAPAASEVVRATSDQSTINLSAATFNVTNGFGISFDNADGTYTFGALALSGGARIAIFNGSSGAFTFGDVDITGLPATQTAVNLTGATGNVTFNTLDITGTSTTGSKGIDLTGNTGTGSIVITNSSTISGVGVGVDLTNASRTGLFQYGDGERLVDVASTITATTPLVITGLNGAIGTYNFADVNLVGDTSGLATSATVYYVLAGATGTGTLGDPGSLAGAELATTDFIILLNDPTGGQDVLDALGTNGNDSLLLDINQALRSFRDSNIIALPGGAPTNVTLTGVATGQVVNPYGVLGDTATDRAPILTTTGAAAALVLANNTSVGGVFVQGVSGQAAVQGSGVSGVTLSNSTFSGAGIALRLADGAASASATLTNLSLSASGANTAVALSGAGAGSLTLSGSGNSVSHSGSGALLTISDVLIGGANLGFTSVASTATGGGVDLGLVGGFGTLSFGSISVAGATGAGVSLHNSSASVNLGNVTVSGAAGTGIALTSNSGATTIGTVNVSSSATGMSMSGLTSTLTVGDGTIDGATVAGILIGAGNTVLLDFGNIDITGLQTGARGVDARLTAGSNVFFATLDISAASATGTRGIDLTGNTGGGAFVVSDSSSITGVGIGVDLTNASRTGTFRYGDGSNVDFDLAASTINATTPIVIAGLNGATGSYNFLDVTLVGDTSPLEVSAFFVRAGATGVGSRSDPGSLAAADTSTASFIVLLDAQAGAGSFDTLSGTLTLANNQSLLSFRDTDTFNVGGGAPPNVLVYNVTTGTITNPNAGSGAPLLTSADAVGTVQLGGTSVIDGVVVSNSGTGAGIFANANAGTATIRNSTISGGGAAIDLRSGAFARIVNLQNLSLANAGSQPGALLNLDGTGGTLTLTGMANLSIDTSGGETAGLVFNTVTFDSDLATGGIQAVNAGALTIGTTGARVQGDGLSLTNVSGALTFSDVDIANNGGTGLLVANSKANNFLLTTLDGSVDTTGGTAVNLDPLTVNMTLASVSATNGAYGILLDQVEGSFTVTGAVTVTGATTAGIAIQDNTAQTDALDATFSGAVTINNASGAGLAFANNAGATLNFAGGGTGVDVVTTSGAGLTASGGGTISFAGAGNSVATTTGQLLNLDGVIAGAGGINFASLGYSNTVADTAILINNLDGGAFSGGTVTLGATSGVGSDGIWIGGGSSSAISFGAVTMGGQSDEGIEINGAGNGAISFSSVTIDNTASHGILITGSDGTVTVSGGTIGNLNDPAGNGVNIDGGSGAITIDAGIFKNTAGGAVFVANRTGDSIDFGGFIQSGGAASGWSILNNSGGTITFSGAGNVINGGATPGLELNNNTGTTINFTGGGMAITSSTTGLQATGGGTLNITGSGNTISSANGNQVMLLNGVTVGAGGINFASVNSTTSIATGIALTNVGSAGGAITLGTVNLQGVLTRGVDVTGTLGAALTIGDLDIGLAAVAATAFDLNGATLAAAIIASDFDVTNAAAAGTSVAVDLRGTTGGQVIRLGDSAAGGAVATIAGVATGVWLDAATNAAFTYGDGESTTDGTSAISAATAINAAAAPVAGSYNFTDVTFAASPGLGFGVGRTLFVDSNGATGGGNGSGADGANPMTLAAAELALATTDVIVLINNGSAISAAGSNGNDTLALLANNQVRGFGQGALALTLTVPSTILLSSNTINIADPTGNGAATLTSAAGANVITLGASGNRISGFILDGDPAGALRGIVDNGGATGTVIDFMTIRNFDAVGGYGIEITPSTNTVIDNVTFTGNTNDVFLNAAGSTLTNLTATGATGTSITIDNATGTTTLTNVNISGAATGMSFTNAGGTVNATNVDVAGAATSALTINGGTAGFNFDGASSIVQATGGLTLNFTGNHTAGIFAFAGLINATLGAGLQFSNADGTYNFTGTTTLNGGGAGIDIVGGATGTFSFGSGTTLTHNAAGNAFVLLSSANVTFDGTITDNDGVAVEIDGHDAGIATFNGAISSSLANGSNVISVANSNGGAINFTGQMAIASTGTAVSLSGNQGSTITFNAGGTGLDITGTTGTAMIITGGGTVNVLGSGNSIATTSGTLLSITDTGGTATAVDLSFASASNTSGANGIFVQRVGAGTITGTVNVAGGAINATTRGVSLNGDALTFTYGGTLTTSGAAARAFEATNRTGGTATLSGNLTDTSLGVSIANNTGGTIAFTGQTISLNTGANAAVTLSNNSGATVSFAPLAGGNGLDIVTTSGTGFAATGGGTINVTGTGNSIQTDTGQVVNLSGVSAGASGISWASLQSTGVVATIAINFNNFDSTGGAFSGGTTSIAGTGGGNDAVFIGNGSAANVTFGATTLGTGANTVSGDGIEINGSGNGTVTFTSVDIDNTTAHGISVIGAAGVTGAIAINGGTIGAGGAGSIGGDGVNITGGSGSVTVAASIAKTNAGNVVEVSSHTGGTVTFSNTISATGAAANGILLSNNSGGSIVFSGATKTLNTGTNNAIQFDNNAATGAAVSFTGGNLDIDTTSGRGITATSTNAGAGSLTIQGTNNTIASVGGIALNLVNTSIAGGGLNFLSISANGGTRGIVLNTTGGSGGLTITGTGTTDGSGGTIQNITQRGIELLNTALVNISNLNLTNASTTGQAAGQDLDLTTANGAIYLSGVATAVFDNINITGTIADNGITGINVSNFQLNNSLITGAGDGAHESGIEFINLSGTSSLTNTEIALSETNSLDIVNTDVNLNLTLNNVIFRDTQSSGIGEGGLQFRSFSLAGGAPTTNIDIVDSDFLRLRTQAVQIIGEDDSVVSVDITNSVIDSQTGIGAGIDINGNDTATVRFNIIGNPTIRSSGGAAINITAFLNANVMGRINNNADIEVYSQTPAGTGASGSGIRLLAQEASQMVVSAAGNVLTQGAGNNSAAVDVIAREGSARLDFTFTSNVIDSTDTNTLADINVQSGSSSGTATETNQIYLNIANNNLTATAAPNLLRLRVSELDNTHDPRIFLQGFVDGGAGIEDDAVATWNANGNTPGGTTANIAVSLTGTATGPSAGTALTPTNPLP